MNFVKWQETGRFARRVLFQDVGQSVSIRPKYLPEYTMSPQTIGPVSLVIITVNHTSNLKLHNGISRNFYRGHPLVLMLYNKLQLKGCHKQLIIEVYKQLIMLRATSFGYLYNHHQAHTKGHSAMPRCDYIDITH